MNEMLMQFFNQSQQEKINSPMYSPRGYSVNNFGNMNNLSLRDQNKLSANSPMSNRNPQFKEMFQDLLMQFMNKN